jgi:pyruvate/2-oxoglutarate dehydrogenase complex dihydrolipoamide acyltransferase (E2) component
LCACNHPTRYNYLLTVAQFGRWLVGASPDPVADAAAADPAAVTRAHVEAFPRVDDRDMVRVDRAEQAQVPAAVRPADHLLEEQEMSWSPMERIRQRKTPHKLVPLLRDDDTSGRRSVR